ncbi:hypothetical protein Scep_025239 [Stephania cephalantha]|uniref:RING-type domain-containing protein n=2 Tax=Magnoliopsida TaxID=3398 RepID=A0AAP0EKF3_9MAGN
MAPAGTLYISLSNAIAAVAIGACFFSHKEHKTPKAFIEHSCLGAKAKEKQMKVGQVPKIAPAFDGLHWLFQIQEWREGLSFSDGEKLDDRPLMELDLDSFLELHNTDDEEDEGQSKPFINGVPHLTLDEIILNNDSSDSSSSSSSPPPTPHNRIKDFSELSPKTSIGDSSVSTRETNNSSINRISRTDDDDESKTLNSAQSNGRIEGLKSDLIGRRKSGSVYGDFSLGRSSSSSRRLNSLFEGVRPSPKPGDALAAAAAASRPVNSRAAAIKWRRASSGGGLERVLSSSDVVSDLGVNESHVEGLDSTGDVSSGVELGILQLYRNGSDGNEKVEIFPSYSMEEHVNVGGFEGLEEVSIDEVRASCEQGISTEVGETFEVNASALHSEEHVNSMTSSGCIESNSNVGDDSKVLVRTDEFNEEAHSFDAGENLKLDEDSSFSKSASVEKENLPSTTAYEEIEKVEENSMSMRLGTQDLEKSMRHDTTDGEMILEVDDGISRSDTNENPFDENLVQLDGKRRDKRLGKKSRSFMKPLELAEELEKKHASSGLHWEEGAAAQPMRLEGIRRGPPAVGYLEIDTDNALTRMLSSLGFRREHGSAQVLAVHANFIAVGMSKGLVAVVPSKYDAHNADYMDAKMLMLVPQGDTPHSPVASMCFNQRGDLLLVGYGNGHLIVWDVPRATVAKVIAGEHKAPVVHILFLGQDSQVTRQFKVVTGDNKGFVLLHTFSVRPLIRFNIKTELLLDAQSGNVLSASSLLIDDFGSGSLPIQGNSASSPGGIGSMMGGVVGGVLFSEGPSLVEEGVVVFVTYKHALVFRLSPKLEKYAQLSKPDGVREGSMPYTAWKYMTHPRGLSTETMPSEAFEKVSLLAIAWDRKVQVAKLVKSELIKPVLKVYKEWSLDSPAIGVAWLDDQMLVVLTVKGQLCLFSKEGNELHQTSFSNDGSGVDHLFAYHTHFLNIFENPEKAYHNCVAVRGATVYILGPMHLVVSRLLPWKERIQVLRRAGDWMGALDMAMRLYDGNAHGVIDLPRTIGAIQGVIMPYLVDLILSYVDEVFSYISVAFANQLGRGEEVHELHSKSSTHHSEMEDQFARVGGVAVEFCVHIKRIDILFDEIFSKFVTVQHGGTFLELLEPYILKDMLGCLPPEIMQALVEHYSKKGWLQRVEQCVLHMDISSLDFNQVVRLCREHGLYGALIYLFNKGLDDFKTPLEELLLLLHDGQRENAAAIGRDHAYSGFRCFDFLLFDWYKSLVYLKYSFSGLAFPPGQGVLPSSRLPSLRKELMLFLLESSNAMNSQLAESFKPPISSCPNLYHLLWLDTEATLEVLRYAFVDDEVLKPDHGLLDVNVEGGKDNDIDNTESLDVIVQNTVNTLICIVDVAISGGDDFSSTDDTGSTWPSRKDIGHLLEFIANFVACRRAIISQAILSHILKFLTSENDVSHSIQKLGMEKLVLKKREKQVLELLKVVPEMDWDSSYVLHLCERVQFYQVCGYIYTTMHQYVAALDSYMKDLDEPIHAFSFINDILLRLRDVESVTFQSAVIDRMSELVDLSREGTFLLVINHFNKDSELILSQLQSQPKSLFLYLKTIIEVHLSGKLDFSCLEKVTVMDVRNKSKPKDLSDELKAFMERISDFPKLIRENPVLINDDMVELYLKLLCQYERDSVLKFLETFENYRLEQCLRLCQEYGVTDAAAFLLERVGDVGNALSHTLSDLNERLSMLDCSVESIVSDPSFNRLTDVEQLNRTLRIPEVNGVFRILHASIGLCQRNTQRLDPDESEFLWFHLLDSFCEPLRGASDVKMETDLKGQGTGMLAARLGIQGKTASACKWRISKSRKGASLLRRIFSQFIREIVEGMIGYVRLPTVMTKLLTDNGDQEFGDFKLTILNMLGTYNFERSILDTAKSLIEDDTYYTMSLLKKGASHGYAPQNLVCCICGSFLTKTYSSIRLFNCGHATHLQCEFQESEVSNGESVGCPVCMPKKKAQRSRNKSVISGNGLVKNSFVRRQQTQGTSAIQHIYESDLSEKSYGVQQISRFEMLNNLQKSKRSFQIENIPQLRLAPPAVYHEKLKKRTDIISVEMIKDEALLTTKSNLLNGALCLCVQQDIFKSAWIWIRAESTISAVSDVVKEKKLKSVANSSISLITKDEGLVLYEDMILGRAFEDMCAQMYYRGKMFGFVHLYNGQEAVSTGFIKLLKNEDSVVSTYRDHVHALSKGVPAKAVMAELFGKKTGCCRGQGGSMHMFSKEHNVLGGFAFIGEGIPVATGAAFTSKYKREVLKEEGSDAVTLAFFGDGTCNNGQFFECLNMAALWKLPIVFVVENNLWAIGMSHLRATSDPEIWKKGPAFGMPGVHVDGMDVLKVREVALEAIGRARRGEGPTLVECETYRFRGHSLADPDELRDPGFLSLLRTFSKDYNDGDANRLLFWGFENLGSSPEKDHYSKRDPIVALKKYMIENNLADEAELKAIEKKIDEVVEEAVEFADASLVPARSQLLENVFADPKGFGIGPDGKYRCEDPKFTEGTAHV